MILEFGLEDWSVLKNVFINVNKLIDELVVQCTDDGLNFTGMDRSHICFFEGIISDTLLNVGVPPEKNNNIYYYQEINKTIKVNTTISEFEKEFVDTYKDSIGYDDIKDLSIEWKSQDNSIARVENGIIKVVKPGKVDIVGTKGNDIDTI